MLPVTIYLLIELLPTDGRILFIYILFKSYFCISTSANKDNDSLDFI